MPGSATLQRAIEAHRGGRLREAEAAYRRILREHPGEPDALNFLGMLRCQAGDTAEAAQLLRRAVEADPTNPHAWINLGNVLVVLRSLDEARSAFTRATELDPERPMAWFNLGVCLGRCGRMEDAASALKRALQLEPGHIPAYESLAFLLHRLGRFSEAADIYRGWLVHDPESAMARHMLAATSGVSAPPRAAEDYVRRLFDGFADEFDENLAALDYRAPQRVAECLGRAGLGEERLDVLDAGCGTGLCAPFLRRLARRLVGADLSAGMIERARARGGYDELVVAEICELMRARQAAFDLVVCADTLVYFGALEEPLAAARACLRRGGVLVFTLERREAAAQEPPYRLERHGRYSHTQPYVRSACAAAGFAQAAVDSGFLRRERGSDVTGHIVLARAG